MSWRQRVQRAVDTYAYLEPEAIEADIDRMQRVRAEWEPSTSELMHEGYPHHSEVARERGNARRRLR